MAQICFINLSVLFFIRYQQSRLLEPVQLQPDRIGGFVKLALQPTQIGGGFAVQEETKQKLNPGFIRD
jgi:hypothetical protein